MRQLERLSRVITVLCTGILTVLILLSPLCHLSSRNGCAPITQNRSLYAFSIIAPQSHAKLPLQKPKRRIPKQNAPPIEITKPGQFNNGNIDIIQPEPSTLTANSSKMNVDEVYINGRRYRVPERVILLDFWDRISNGKTGAAAFVTL